MECEKKTEVFSSVMVELEVQMVGYIFHHRYVKERSRKLRLTTVRDPPR
jgi:hypothetical protein